MVRETAAPPQARKCGMDRAPTGPVLVLVPGLARLADPLQPLRRPARSPGLTSLTSPCQSLSVRSPSMSPPACAGRLHRRLPSPPLAPVTAATPALRSPERARHLGASAPPPPAPLPPRQPPRRKGRRSRAPTTALLQSGAGALHGTPGTPGHQLCLLGKGTRKWSPHTTPDPIIPGLRGEREGGCRTGGCHPLAEKPNSPHPANPCLVRPPLAESEATPILARSRHTNEPLRTVH